MPKTTICPLVANMATRTTDEKYATIWAVAVKDRTPKKSIGDGVFSS